MKQTRICALLTISLSFGLAAVSTAQAGPSAANLKRHQPVAVNATRAESLRLGQPKSDQLVVEIGIIDIFMELAEGQIVATNTSAENSETNTQSKQGSRSTLASTANLVSTGVKGNIRVDVAPGGLVSNAVLTSSANPSAEVATFVTSKFRAAKFAINNTEPFSVTMPF